MDPSLIIPLLIVLLAVPMFLQARKQKRTMKDQQQLQNSLSIGDRVMTTSGMFGTVVDTGDDNVELEIAPGVITSWVRAAVREKANIDSDSETSEDLSDEFAEEFSEEFSEDEVVHEESESVEVSAEIESHDKVEETKTS